MQSVKDEVKALGLAENTMFTGHITDEKLLNGLYQATTLFVFPSIYDTCGLVVREAAAMGTPAVVVEGSGAAEQIIDRENGFICLDNDLSLHDAIVYALDQPDIAKRVGMAARKTLCISWDSIIDSVINRYANLIKKTD
jgi:glycosyltransferase involved in cell wall biosynthesis